MLDAFSSLNPAWAKKLTCGDLVRCRFPDPLDYTRRSVRLCAVSDIDRHHGGIFVELVPAIPAAEQAPEPGDILFDPTALIPGVGAGPSPLWLRPDIAERFDTAHAGILPDLFGGAPVVGRLFGDALTALDQLRARHQALRDTHIADRRARRAGRRKAR